VNIWHVKVLEVSDINVEGVWGSMVTGGGCSDLIELLGTMGIPDLKSDQFSKLEGQKGEWWRDFYRMV
jgi:hypothetical protein